MSDQTAQSLQNFVAALQRNDRRVSNENAQSLIQQRAALGDKWRLIAKVMQTNGEVSLADQAMALLVEQSANRDLAMFERATIAAQVGRLEDASAILQSLPGNVPDPASHAYLRGTMAMNFGQIDEAEQFLLAAIEANPQLGQPHLALAKCRKRKEGDPLGDRILAAGSAMANALPAEQAQYHFAAGSVQFDRKQADSAFEHFTQGAGLMATQRSYDHAADRREATISHEGYERDEIQRLGDMVQTDTSDAIFVTGLPRSGTTLVEQILASHSAVVGGQELGSMGVVQRDLSQNSYRGLKTYGANAKLDNLSKLYLHLARERFGEAGRFVDKGLNNPRFIGMIASLLPQSPIIWLRRDPLDCAWSAYRTFFATGLEWSWKLEDIAHHFRIEDALFRFWSELLPDRILVVNYARLVNEPQAQIERILSFCNLASEPAVFEPHRTSRVVATASTMQVREPIGTGALGAADPYREHLRPFSDAYAGTAAS
ncbi:sulfotransferase [Alteriqipengyuania sp.]|uniref:tetratricopeptide repeat-containing sulfotransferase family protein n=1 Tax=Alteriqipengyuania sp. TaxID=2800692 RepID=UPI0035177554